MAKYGYVSGPRQLKRFLVGNTGAIEDGDILTYDGGGNQYVMRAADAETEPIGVAAESTSAPTADGDVSILVDIHPESIFRMPIVAGTMAATKLYDKCDIGVSGTSIGADVDTSVQGVILLMDWASGGTDVLAKVIFTPGSV